MNKNTYTSLEDATVLTRSVENLFRKLIRFLIGRISLVKLQELVRYIFVEEIENKLRQQDPDKNVSLTKIALLSGLDTRTLSKIRNSDSYRQPFHVKTQFLKQSVPGASIIDFWRSNQAYLNPKDGQPLQISISGPEPSFEALFQESTKSRGITYTSLLSRLEDSETVKTSTNGKMVELVSNKYLPGDSEDINGAIELGFSALSNLTDTVTSNIRSLTDGSERLFQRGAWTYRLNPANRTILRNELKDLLEETDNEARKIISKFEDPHHSGIELTAGISLFYFEEESSES